jgi:hypothetical protein
VIKYAFRCALELPPILVPPRRRSSVGRAADS